MTAWTFARKARPTRPGMLPQLPGEVRALLARFMAADPEGFAKWKGRLRERVTAIEGLVALFRKLAPEERDEAVRHLERLQRACRR